MSAFEMIGRPEWQTGTLVLSILIPGFAIAVAMMWVLTFVTKPGLSIQVVVSVASLVMTASFGCAWALARLQNGGYKAFKAGGWEALQGFECDIRSAILFGAGISLVMGLIMIFLIPGLRA
jgi:hypothetical protein